MCRAVRRTEHLEDGEGRQDTIAGACYMSHVVSPSIGCSFAAAAAAAVATATVDPSNTGLTRSDNTAEITTATATM